MNLLAYDNGELAIEQMVTIIQSIVLSTARTLVKQDGYTPKQALKELLQITNLDMEFRMANLMLMYNAMSCNGEFEETDKVIERKMKND